MNVIHLDYGTMRSSSPAPEPPLDPAETAATGAVKTGGRPVDDRST